MSWQKAKSIADIWAKERGFSRGLTGQVLLLPDFATEEDCRFFHPDRPLAFHRMILQAASRTARKRGAKIVTSIVSAREFRRSGRQDTPQERSAFLDSLSGIAAVQSK